MPVCAEILISGRVQGVYFRAFTQQAAQRLGLSGYCRNLPDGRVEVTAEGDRDVIEVLLEQLRVGPPRAKVEEVQVAWNPCSGRFKEFSIRHD